MNVRLVNSAVDVLDDRLILRGVVDPMTFRHLKIDDYQREALPLKTLQPLVTAMKSGAAIPDIELGMRGPNYRHKEGTYTLQDEVFIIDGQQRISAANYLLMTGHPADRIRIGATVHFDTTKEWERDRFRILNTLRKPVAPTVLMRNMRDDYSVVGMLYDLCSDSTFAACNRVSWAQHMNRNDLITGVVLARTMGYLHSHKGPGIASGIHHLIPGLQRLSDSVGMNLAKTNMITFFNVLDGSFGVRQVQYKVSAHHLRLTFLCTLARLFALHKDFWKNAAETRLYVDADMRNKLATFPMQDPTVKHMASQATRFNPVLYNLLLEHLNKGKRSSNRLVRRDTYDTSEGEELVVAKAPALAEGE